jgi:Mg2+ and Co2+ transporter CorA
MEDLIHHYLKRLQEKTLTKEQRDYYKEMVDHYSTLYLEDLYS